MDFSFGGEFLVSRSPEEVYDFLTDANRFCPLLPDFQSMETADARHFTVTVLVGVSHIRGNAKVKLELTKAERPRYAVYQGSGNLVGGTATLTAAFELDPVSQGTRVSWRGQAQIVGRLPSVAGGLLEPLAKKNLQKLIDGLQQALASGVAGSVLA
jgi:carbon monoxide dehydrogenase subunit G